MNAFYSPAPFFTNPAIAPANIPGLRGGGVWHSDSNALTRICTAIVAKPVHWAKVRRRLKLGGESLVRPPRGFWSRNRVAHCSSRLMFSCRVLFLPFFLPCVPHRVFNSMEFIVFDFSECLPFPTRQLSVVLQNEANE